MNGRNKDLILLILDMQGIEDRLREFERMFQRLFRFARCNHRHRGHLV